MTQRITLYCLCWNEARIIPWFLRHYLAIVDRIVVHDNGSTDGTLALLRGEPRVEVRPFLTTGDSFVDLERQMSDNMWRESRGRDDWVMLLDMDEHLHHADWRAYLAACAATGVTAVRAIGYEMVAETLPGGDGLLCDRVTRGVRSPAHDKLCLFDPAAIEQTRFAYGRHGAAPVGRVVWPAHREVTMLHYKNLGAAYVTERNKVLRRGLRRHDVRMGWGRQYLRSPAAVSREFRWLRQHARPVPGLRGAPLPTRATRDDSVLARHAGLILADWYVETYADVADAGIDPLMHYQAIGWREGRRPNPHFDPSWYVTTYGAGLGEDDPLLDYVRHGERDGRRPSPEFDPDAYRRRHAIAPRLSPLWHRLYGAERDESRAELVAMEQA